MPFCQLYAIGEKLRVRIQGGGSRSDQRRQTHWISFDELSHFSSIKSGVPYVQVNVLREETQTRENFDSKQFYATRDQLFTISQRQHLDLVLNSDLSIGHIARDVIFMELAIANGTEGRRVMKELLGVYGRHAASVPTTCQ
jgi:hypothetical protein